MNNLRIQYTNFTIACHSNKTIVCLSERETELPSVASGGGATGGASFDPQHPYAFVPPDYDSLPKEPPKYVEVFEHVNDAFQPDVPPPPSQFHEEENSFTQKPETPPPMYEANPIHTTNVPLNPFTGVPLAGSSGPNTVNPSSS